MVALLGDLGDVLAALGSSRCGTTLRRSLISSQCAATRPRHSTAPASRRSVACARSIRPSWRRRPRQGLEPGATTAEPTSAREWSEVFLPVPEAVGGARRFVSSALRTWGSLDPSWEASLLTSELATNTVVHGRSPFRLDVSRLQGVVRIAIEDTARTWPEQRLAASHDWTVAGCPSSRRWPNGVAAMRCPAARLPGRSCHRAAAASRPLSRALAGWCRSPRVRRDTSTTSVSYGASSL